MWSVGVVSGGMVTGLWSVGVVTGVGSVGCQLRGQFVQLGGQWGVISGSGLWSMVSG